MESNKGFFMAQVAKRLFLRKLTQKQPNNPQSWARTKLLCKPAAEK